MSMCAVGPAPNVSCLLLIPLDCRLLPSPIHSLIRQNSLGLPKTESFVKGRHGTHTKGTYDTKGKEKERLKKRQLVSSSPVREFIDRDLKQRLCRL